MPDRQSKDRPLPERDQTLKTDFEAQPDDLGNDAGEVGPNSAGQSGDTQQLSPVAEANEESVEELAESGQDLESSVVDGVEDAAGHPERPTHTHQDYGRPDDVPPRRRPDIDVTPPAKKRA